MIVTVKKESRRVADKTAGKYPRKEYEVKVKGERRTSLRQHK